MKLNTQLYQKLRGGLAVTSPATAVISDASGNIGTAKAQLNQLPGGAGDSYIAQLDAAQSQLNAANGHIEGQKAAVLTQLGQADLVNRLDETSDQVPAGCMNTLGGTGMLTGEFNDQFQGIADKAAAMSQAVADYLSGAIDLSQLQGLLDGFGSDLDGFGSSLSSGLSSELALLAELKEKVLAMSQSQAIENLWSNPCSKAVLEQTLPDDVKGLLP